MCPPTAGTVLLVDALTGAEALLFEGPREIVTTNDPGEVAAALARIEALSDGGLHLAGFCAYEMGHVFEHKLRARLPARLDGSPLLWFGAYDAPRTLSAAEARRWLENASGGAAGHVHGLRFEMDRAAYRKAFEQVRRHLASGDIYQANLTLRARFTHSGSAAGLFLELLRRQPVSYAALVATQGATILSLSPELFLERAGDQLTTKPMKGTAPRGVNAEADTEIARWLAADVKSQAENLMIVDLMRNDLSRISRPGSVRISKKFEVERYRSLHQMVTTVRGQLNPQTGFADVFAALYPCGSITGAPKLSAQAIIDDLETSPRGVYTGAIGHIRPGGDFRFNVAIRTLTLRPDGTGEIGTGSGVVFDSDADDEYDECHLKLAFLTGEDPPFGLIETMGFDPQHGYMLQGRHMARLQRSAQYFGFRCPLPAIEAALAARADTFDAPRRVRLELAESGTFDITDAPLAATSENPWRLAVSPERMDAGNRFLFHKTTRRAHYDDERVRLQGLTGCDEALFLNADGLVTEGSFTNLFIRKDGSLLTPALGHGLLPGILREALLDTGRAVEADLRLEDFVSADAIYAGNSLRGLIKAVLIGEE
ncbi:aminodeoxychorismate synthase component I [Breoghania sp. L-A4]|nr:aminodeoxychorismate synthase component I [Breoghania sp. L-A4]